MAIAELHLWFGHTRKNQHHDPQHNSPHAVAKQKSTGPAMTEPKRSHPSRFMMPGRTECQRSILRLCLLFMVCTVWGEQSPDSTNLVPGDHSPEHQHTGSHFELPHSSDDTLAQLDTLKTVRRALADSLRQQSHLFRERFLRDSLLLPPASDPLLLDGPRLFSTDAISISEALAANPWIVRVPQTLTNRYNRFLFRGYPTPWPREQLPPPNAAQGTDVLFVSPLTGIDLSSPDGPAGIYHPQPMTGPAANLFWENGLLGESVVRVLFARPVARTVDLAVHSGFRAFNGERYDHTRGGIYSFYRDLYKNPELTARGGRHPLINEHSAGVRSAWKAPNGSRAQIGYHYLDCKNNFAFARNADTISLDTSYLWQHALDFVSPQLDAGPFSTTLAIDAMRSTVRTLNAADTRGLLADTIAGRQRTLEFTLQSYVPPVSGHTFGLRIEPSLRRFILCDNSLYDINSAAASLTWEKTVPIGLYSLGWSAEAGHTLHSVNQTYGSLWTGHAQLKGSGERSWIQLHATRTAQPYHPPYDTANLITTTVYDQMEEAGISVSTKGDKSQVLVSCVYRTGVDSATLIHAWPYGIAPYDQPRLTVLLAPAVRPLPGLDLFARYLLSDKKPYHKISGGISWTIRTIPGSQNICLDLLADYWSPREARIYGRTDIWSREIINVSLKTTVQVQSLRLFLKMDNLLNRSIAYMPGNTMTGLTFRWGFNWFLER